MLQHRRSAPADGVMLTVTNDDAGILVTESGRTDTFGVRLAACPSANTNVTVAGTDSTERLISVGSIPTPAAQHLLTFSPDNWNTNKIVTVIGQTAAERFPPQRHYPDDCRKQYDQHRHRDQHRGKQHRR